MQANAPEIVQATQSELACARSERHANCVTAMGSGTGDACSPAANVIAASADKGVTEGWGGMVNSAW